jgi:hypothetical protein
MKRRTPQEKKALSYAKDRRNCYGESDKGSRISIRLNKIKPQRAFRRNVNQILQSEAPVVSGQETDAVESKVKGVRRRDWYKHPDMPLGEYVELKLERRLRDHGAKVRRRENWEKRKRDAGN